MSHVSIRKVAFTVVVSFSFVALGWAQKKETTIKKVPIQHTSPGNGAAMYKSYCAACHGPDAKGNGPAASALKELPPDLTTLAKRNDGKFPETRVMTLLEKGVKGSAHGTSDMPVWGPLFAHVSGHDPSIVNMRISNLIRYMETLQVK